MLQQIGTLILTAITSISLFVTTALLPKATPLSVSYALGSPLPLRLRSGPWPTPTPSPTSKPTSRPLPKVTLIEGNSILENVNVYRSSLGLGQLVRHEGLCNYAQTRSAQIQANWSHGPFNADISNGTLSNACTECFRWGENLGKGYGSSAAAVNGWIASSGHRANMAGSWDLGCGVFTSNGYGVMIFGKRK